MLLCTGRPSGDDGGRFEWVALYNHSGHLANPFHPPIPIHDVKISLQTDHPIRRVVSLTNGTMLERSGPFGPRVSVRLPRLDVFELPLVEYVR